MNAARTIEQMPMVEHPGSARPCQHYLLKRIVIYLFRWRYLGSDKVFNRYGFVELQVSMGKVNAP